MPLTDGVSSQLPLFSSPAHVAVSEVPPESEQRALTLYPGQVNGVERFCELKFPRRMVMAWDTGCGKTAGACEVLNRLQPLRVLIVCPALVREHWKRELKKWAPKFAERSGVIQWGRGTKLNGINSARRNKAYGSSVQIVSYDLLHHVTRHGWDLVILDEVHHLANPLTQVAKTFRDFMRRDPLLNVLALSATLIPTEAQQLWNPMHELFPRDGWGQPYKGNQISWTFKRRYCNLEKNEYGTEAFGVRESMRPELRARLLKSCHVLTRDDISQDLPPLDLHALTLEHVTRNRKGDQHPIIFRCVEWAEGNYNVDKIVVLVHHRANARAIYDHVCRTSLDLRLHHAYYIDGNTPTHSRDIALANCAAAPRAILVGTHGALLEGIRLMWADQVLIDEWSMSPGRMTQLMGRFNSIGSTRRPCVNLAVDERTYGPAQMLIYRLKVVTDLLGTGKTQQQMVDELERSGKMSEDNLKEEWLDMFDNANLDEGRENWTLM